MEFAINDQSSPKAMFDFGYDFLQGLQQIEIYKGASGAIWTCCNWWGCKFCYRH